MRRNQRRHTRLSEVFGADFEPDVAGQVADRVDEGQEDDLTEDLAEGLVSGTVCQEGPRRGGVEFGASPVSLSHKQSRNHAVAKRDHYLRHRLPYFTYCVTVT